MMKKVFTILVLALSISCTNTTTKNTGTDTVDKEQIISTNKTVKTLLEEASDYQGLCMEVFEEDSAYAKLRISSEFFKGDSKETISMIVNKDLVYVAYQIFASTDINNVEVISRPVLKSDLRAAPCDGAFMDNHSKTLIVTREKAVAAMKKFSSAKNFSELFAPEYLKTGLKIPGKEFNKLKGSNLNKVIQFLTN